MFSKIAVSKSAVLLKIESVAANCPEIRLLLFYQFTFCCLFFRAMVSCLKQVFLFLFFVVDYRKVPKHCFLYAFQQY